MRIPVKAAVTAVAVLACVIVTPADANGGKKSSGVPASIALPAAPRLPPCNGTFSSGTQINVNAPANMVDVGVTDPQTTPLPPATQTACDFHSFAWNQFIYYTQTLLQGAGPGTHPAAAVPRFMTMAPWYNALKANGSPPPGKFPGGAVDLQTAMLDQGQAGDDDHLVDVAGNTVRYDIRFDSTMYQSIVLQNLYTQALYAGRCLPDPTTGICKNNLSLWMIPSGANEHAEPGAIEFKTSWRDFGAPGKCPATQFYCNGRFGLVGLHFVNKTFSHGEWIWASFEHVANAPDCTPGGEEPIASKSPIGAPWSFFNPATAGSGVMTSKICSVTGASPQCNANPVASGTGKAKVYKAVNVCRTDVVAAGGASAANCQVMPAGTPQATANNAGNVACLNASLMPKRTGVWKNYKLVGAQWVKGGIGPNQDFRIQVFQSAPPPTPKIPYAEPNGFVHMADTTMETWMQKGSTGYDPFKTNATQAGCFLCHNMPSGGGGNAGRQVDMSHFPGKLPPAKLMALRNALISATSSVKAPN